LDMTKGRDYLWKKGVSPNPSGRPKGSGSMATYLADPKLFGIRYRKWWWFCLYYTTAITKIGNATEAARKAGYSANSARFIASRLLKKPVIREMLRKNYEIQAGTRSLGNGLYMIPNEDGGYRFYQKTEGLIWAQIKRDWTL